MRLDKASRTRWSSSTTKTTGLSSSWGYARHRKGKREGGTYAFIGCGPQPAVMRIDDGAANRQSHAHAVFFRGEESFEDFVWILEAGATIPHLHQDRFGLGRLEPMNSFLGRSTTGSMASMPLRSRLKTTCCNCTRSPSTAPSPGPSPSRRRRAFWPSRLSAGVAPRRSPHSDRARFSQGRLLEQRPNAPHTSPASLPSRTILSAASCALAMPEGWAASQRRQAWPFVTTAARGWLISCAMAAANSPTVAVWIARDSRAWLWRKASSSPACLRSAISLSSFWFAAASSAVRCATRRSSSLARCLCSLRSHAPCSPMDA